MNKTGVFATKEETTMLFDMAAKAWEAPVMTLRTDQEDFASSARRSLNEGVYRKALAHGLPEIKGYYGLTKEGEFVTT